MQIPLRKTEEEIPHLSPSSSFLVSRPVVVFFHISQASHEETESRRFSPMAFPLESHHQRTARGADDDDGVRLLIVCAAALCSRTNE